MSTGSSWKPLPSSTVRNEGTIRSCWLSKNLPMSVTRTPKNPANTPFVMDPLERAAMTVMANTMIRNFSTAENLMASLARGGVKKNRASREISPPIRDTVMPILSALSPSPLAAMGWPSKPVVMEDGVPGILIRMAGTRPPLIPPT